MNKGISYIKNILKSEGGAFFCFLILFIFASIQYDEFLSIRNLTNILQTASILGIVAAGMTMVILTGGIDLSVGSIFALSGVLVAKYIQGGVLTSIIITLAAASLCGFLNGIIITKLKIEPFIVTLSILVGARGMCYLLTNSNPISINKEIGKLFFKLGRGRICEIPISGMIFVLICIIVSIILKRTHFGRSIYAIGDNETGAGLLGVKIDKTKIIVYTLSGILAGLAGIILASKLGVGQPTAGEMYELQAILAVVIGGTLITGGVGNIRGTFIAILILGLIDNIFNLQGNINSWLRNFCFGIILLIMVVIQEKIKK